MLSPQAILKGIVNRALNLPSADGVETERAARMGRYGDIKVESAWPTDHLLADEGAYMVATMTPGQTNLFIGINATFSATLATIVLGNSDITGVGKRLYPRFIRMSVSAVAVSGTDQRYAIVLDNKDRTPSTLSSGTGGTGVGTPASATMYRAQPVCTNMDIVTPNIVGVPYFVSGVTGAGTPGLIPAPGPLARTIVANGTLKNSIAVVKDQYIVQFGGVDFGGTMTGAAAIAKIVDHAPAVCIGPGQFMVFYLWATSSATNSTAFDDLAIGWIEK